MSGRIGASGHPPLLINLQGEGQRKHGGRFKSAHESSKWNAWSAFSTVRTSGNEACFDEECQKMLCPSYLDIDFIICSLFLYYTFLALLFTRYSPHSCIQDLTHCYSVLTRKKSFFQHSCCSGEKS